MNNHTLPALLGITLLLAPALPLYPQELRNDTQSAENQPAATDQEQVLAAALEGQLDIIVSALKNGYKVNSLDPAGRTAIMYAAYNGHAQIVRELIQAGAEVDLKDQGGSTALMFAASGPFIETVTLLLDNGADVNATDSGEHFSALMWAAAEGQLEVVKLLLQRGADLTLKDVDGDTAESFASKAGKFEVAQVLKTAASKNEEQKSGDKKE